MVENILFKSFGTSVVLIVGFNHRERINSILLEFEKQGGNNWDHFKLKKKEEMLEFW